MKTTSRDNTQPLVTEHGEVIHELIGRVAPQRTERHSVAHVVLATGRSSRLHVHPQAEESYFVLQGQGRMVLGQHEFSLGPGQAVLIPPTTAHQITCSGEESLEFIAVCVPAWEPGNESEPGE